LTLTLLNIDVKPDNILLHLDNVKPLIEAKLAQEPSKTFPILQDQGNLPLTVVSQPIHIDHIPLDNPRVTIILADFGQGKIYY
jgi:hypothetical protein